MDQFKLHKENECATGNNIVDFPYVAEMTELMGHWVNVEPEITFSFGAKANKTEKKKDSAVPPKKDSLY